MKFAGSVVAWCLALVAALGPVGTRAQTDIANVPLITAAPGEVRPNLMFVLDDSGSMAFDFMPDHVANYTCRSYNANSPQVANYNDGCCRDASNTSILGRNFSLVACWRGEPGFNNFRGAPPFMNADINGVYYNPATRYLPPARADGSTFPAMDSGNTGGWANVPMDAYRVQSTATINLLTQFPDTEWCTDESYSDCLRNGNYVLPGQVDGKVYSVFHATEATGTGIVANGEPDEATTETRDLGPHYYSIIPAEYCDSDDLRRCQATRGGAFQIPAPQRWCNSERSARALAPPVGSCQATRTPNPGNADFNFVSPRYPTVIHGGGVFPGSFVRVDIVPSRAAYPRAATRTDCAGATCTYEEEMTNFANWWAYYHTRMQAMKSATSLAFEAVDDTTRVGFASINNSAGADFLNLDTFDGDHRASWYEKLQASNPRGGTPLRSALSTVGRLYAGRLNGKTLNGSTVTEPMQYSCQRNYTILSTDGFWNEGATPTQVDATTPIGDQDADLPRPRFDGNTSANTLADVAAYYYETDLRQDCGTGTDLCTDNVPAADGEGKHQRMTTFTLGLGVSGVMRFTKNYESAATGDFAAVLNGTPADPANGVCAWQSGGPCNWPVPLSNTLTAVDDLWHAAINGRGTYFSAADPVSLSAGIEAALRRIGEEAGAAAASTTGNPNLTGNDDAVYVSGYTTGQWTGTLSANPIDAETGVISATTSWEAHTLLNANTNRRILTYAPGAAGRLKPFAWDSLNATEKAYFSLANIRAAGRSLRQFCNTGLSCLDATAQATAAGERLVNFLRGDRRDEEGLAGDPTKFFRARVSLLGDIINSEAAIVGEPLYRYADAGYAEYKAQRANRPATVYVGANDGMLHAFDADSGDERWAYVPSMVMPDLYRLADKDYANNHRYYVDGSPVVGDIKVGDNWRTLLVGGLGAGGRGYYALDVTDPDNPQALWEFTHDTSKGAGYTVDENLGLSVGKAEITKLKDGTWVVIVASGYNNVAPGDGRGYLYVLNARTGNLIRTIDTGAGAADAPSGLAHIRAWVDATTIDNTTLRVYGGDELGNVWRFDVNGDVGGAGYEAQRLATLRGRAGNVQPVTARPELGLVGSTAVVYVGTGRYLGVSDLSDDSPQTLYAIRDELTNSGYDVPRSDAGFVAQTLTDGTCPEGLDICTEGSAVRTGSSNPVNLAVNRGWYVDLPSGERSTNEPSLALGTIAFTTNLSTGDACAVGGSSYLNYFDYRTGAPVTTSSGVVSLYLDAALASRPVLVRLKNEKVVSVTRLSDQSTGVREVPIAPASSGMRRVTWRELTLEP